MLLLLLLLCDLIFHTMLFSGYILHFLMSRTVLYIIYDESKIGTVCYFFFDTTMGWQTTLSLVVLLVILTLFYGFFAMADSLLEFGWVGNGSYYSGASLGMSISRLKEFLPMGELR